jgi:opacity protein-like surface antigen
MSGATQPPRARRGISSCACRLRLVMVCMLLAVTAAPAQAQARARVSVDQANLWRENFFTVILVLKQGAEVELIGRRGNWYEVRVIDRASTRGFVSVTQLDVIEGEPPVEGRRTRGLSAAQPPGARSLRGFGQIGYTRWNASRSFEAVLGSAGGVTVGGGGEVRFGSLFVQGSIDVFRKTGERVVVLDDEVFPLGIDNTVTVVPLAATVGYTRTIGRTESYIGGGVGQVFYREHAEFAIDGDDVSDRFTSYHVLGGAEVYRRNTMHVAVEVQYTHVPNALDGGVAERFDEHNLGGVQVRLKVSFGR